MAKVITSKTINFSQLDKELGSQGLSFDDNDLTAIVIVTSDDSTITQSALESGVKAHVAVPTPEPTIAEKLASVGLTVVDLKTALGL